MEEKKIKLFGLPISNRGLKETIKWIFERKLGGNVYCCTLNEVVEADENNNFKKILSGGDILTADGMPLVWEMRRKMKRGERVYGPDLMKEFLETNRKKIAIKQLFIGGKENEKYFSKYGKYLVLPYKDVFEKSDYKEMVGEIIKSKAKVVWIGLGAKKQIIMADELRKRLPNIVYITVGAAFDFLSENKKQSPKWLRNIGGEWMFRLFYEPKRLGGRYLKCAIFLIKFYGKELTDVWKSGVPGDKNS